MIHILNVLTVAFHHIHNTRALYQFDIHHGAITFLRSGITSENPATKAQAVSLLQWLVNHHVAPVDW